MHHAFISYSRRDITWVDALTRTLAAMDIAVWIDRRDIAVSLPWLDEIRDAIEDAALVVICDSPTWRASPACAAEKTVTDELGKEVLSVEVGEDQRAAAWAISLAVRQLPPSAAARTELRGRARQWHRTGRSRGSLASRRELRRFRSATRGQHRTPVEMAFLAASRRRHLGRAALALGTTAAISVPIAGVLALNTAQSQVQSRTSATALAYLESNDAIEALRLDVYEGLALAATRGDNEAVVSSEVITAALAEPVPDDAFIVEPGAAGFHDEVVGSTVVVTAEDGTAWQRDADAPDQRSATLAADPGAPASPRHEVVLDDTAVVEIHREGTLHRRLNLGLRPELVAVSPDGRTLAASIGKGTVELIDVATGHGRGRLRGAPAILDLAWSEDGGRLWAAVGRGAVSWPVRTGRVVLDEPGTKQIAVMPSEHETRVWLLSDNGRFREFDAATGEVVSEIQLDEVLGARISSSRQAAVMLTGANTIDLVDLAEGTTRPVPVPDDCDPRVPMIDAHRNRLIVPCEGGPLRVLDLPSGDPAGTIALADAPFHTEEVRTLAVSDDDRVFAGTAGGHVYEVGDDRAELLTMIDCRPEVLFLTVAPQSAAVLPVGTGLHRTGCFRIGIGAGDGWVWNTQITRVAHSTRSTAAAFLGDGSAFAIGYGDGSIVLRPTANLEPAVKLHELSGRIRSMHYHAATDELLAATDDGMLLAIPAAKTPSNAKLAVVAFERLSRAAQLGLFDADDLQERLEARVNYYAELLGHTLDE